MDKKKTNERQHFLIKNCKVNLTKIIIPPSTVSCPSCNKKVANLSLHFASSFICSQAQVQANSQPSQSEPKKMPNKRKLNKDNRKGVTKCLSCSKDFVNLNLHLSKSFSCQNSYNIDEKINSSFESDIIGDDPTPAPKV